MREMEALNSGDKKRVLPTWMTAQEPEKRMRLVKTPKRRKMDVVPAAAVRWDSLGPWCPWGIRRRGRDLVTSRFLGLGPPVLAEQ